MSDNAKSAKLDKAISQDIWYRNPMVWFIILLPLSVVLASIITIGIAHKYAPTLVLGTPTLQSLEQALHVVEQHPELDQHV